MLCKNYRGVGTCRAYPNDIPNEIYQGRHDHRKPFPGDGGIMFEPDPIFDDPTQTPAKPAPKP